MYVASNLWSKRKGKTLSRKSEGGEGGVWEKDVNQVKNNNGRQTSSEVKGAVSATP